MSKGTVQLNRTDEGPRDEYVVSANLHIENCSNLNVTVLVAGNNASVSSQLLVDAMMAEVYGDEVFEDKSFALIYAHNETRSMDRIFRIGHRQPSDALLKTEKIRVNNELTSFPQYEIAFDDPTAFITQMEFTFNVSHPIIFIELLFLFYYCCWNVVHATLKWTNTQQYIENVYQIERKNHGLLLLIDCTFFYSISF